MTMINTSSIYSYSRKEPVYQMPSTDDNLETYMIQKIQIDTNGVLYKVKRYDILQICGLLGGLFFFVSRVVSSLIAPIQAHSFRMHAL